MNRTQVRAIWFLCFIVGIAIGVCLFGCKSHEIEPPRESSGVEGHLGESIGLNKSTRKVLAHDRKGNSVETGMELLLDQMKALTNAFIQREKEQSTHAQMYKNLMNANTEKRLAEQGLIDEQSRLFSKRQRDGAYKITLAAVLAVAVGVFIWGMKAGWIATLVKFILRK